MRLGLTISGSLEAESFWKKFGNVRLRGTIDAFEEHRCIGPELVDHLPARTARRARHSTIVRHSDGLDFDLRSQFSHGREDRRALGTVRHAIRSILHIAAGKYFPV